LALNTLFGTMARDDKFIFGVAQKVFFSGMGNDVETILYRQKILQDCLKQPTVVRELYSIAIEAMEEERKHFLSTLLTRHPKWVLRHSTELMEAFLGLTKKLRKIADLHASKFASEGWSEFFLVLQKELSDEYFALVQDHLEQLKFRKGILLSTNLGKGNKAGRYTLHALRPLHPQKKSWLTQLVMRWLQRLFGQQPPVIGFTLHPRDESGHNALEEIQNQGIGQVTNAFAQSTDHVHSFFNMLRTELAFYVGCINLHEHLAQKGEPLCFASPVVAEEHQLSFRGLYDICLALSVNQRVVGNDANADKQDLVIVTGANQGGKSTFLRSVGLAQLMMQCGMFAPADYFCSSVCDGLFTHYKREEDTSMKSGKLDEELGRMNDIVDHITSNPMILFNESFAATNEREGSEIAQQIVSALLDHRVRIVYVTHLYELARTFHERDVENILFLRADRQADGTRTFKLVKGEPLPTSFGEDLYASIFDAKPDHNA